MVKAAVQHLIAQELSVSTEAACDDVDAFLAQRFPHLWSSARIEQTTQKFEKVRVNQHILSFPFLIKIDSVDKFCNE